MYTPKEWKDHIVQHLRRYRMLPGESEETVYLIPSPGEIQQQGTPQNAENFNHMENGIYENSKAIDGHINDTEVHISEEERQGWNEMLSDLAKRLNALADSDDITLDQLSEIVTYIKSNRDLIDAITTSKVSVADIIDNLTSTATNKPLSAKQGKVLNEKSLNKHGDTVDGAVNFKSGGGLAFLASGLEDEGGHARGMTFCNIDGTRYGGIGVTGASGVYGGIYIGANTASPWDKSSGLFITGEDIKWKNSKLITENGGVINGNLTTDGGIEYAGRNGYIAYPDDGYLVGSVVNTGYIMILLPEWLTQSSNIMVNFTVTLSNMSTGTSVEYHLAGYLNVLSDWSACTAFCVGKPGASHSNLAVRFGKYNGRYAVTIGEATTRNSYLGVKIHDIAITHNGNATFGAWKSGWDVEVTTTELSSINTTINDTHVAYGCVAGSCIGNSASATKATQDGDGNVIKDSYVKKDLNFIYKIEGKTSFTVINASKYSEYIVSAYNGFTIYGSSFYYEAILKSYADLSTHDAAIMKMHFTSNSSDGNYVSVEILNDDKLKFTNNSSNFIVNIHAK